MAQSVREVSAECPHARWESAFIEGIDFSLLRDLYRTGMGLPSIMLEMMMRVDGVFAQMHKETLTDTHSCIDKMIAQLKARAERKIAGISCPEPEALMLYANGDAWPSTIKQTKEHNEHCRKCPECARDIRQWRGKFPDFNRLKDRSIWS